MKPTAKLAKLLRTSEEVILKLEKKMDKISGQKDVVEKIIRENEDLIRDRLIKLGFGTQRNFFETQAEEVYNALIKETEKSNKAIVEHFHQPNFSTKSGCQSIINATKELTGNLRGFYLKEEKAKELFRLNPPKNIMSDLGYGDDIEKMLKEEDISELFCALRFAEESDWLNNVFFVPYKDLKASDFEERETKVMVLPERWSDIGEKFLGKKLHPMSHLKEMGIIFVIPFKKEFHGMALYLFFMTLHYTFEVDWHSRLFKAYSAQTNFAKKMIDALKVEVSSMSLPNDEKMSWRMMPKYLAKKDDNDPRLKEPHVSPEAWHYTRVSNAINDFAERFPELKLDFWSNLEWVGDYFPVNSKEESLISFDLYDNGVALLKKAGFGSKFIYHQQEALWNKIFSEYMGEEKMDQIMMENLDKGYVTL